MDTQGFYTGDTDHVATAEIISGGNKPPFSYNGHRFTAIGKTRADSKKHVISTIKAMTTPSDNDAEVVEI